MQNRQETIEEALRLASDIRTLEDALTNARVKFAGLLRRPYTARPKALPAKKAPVTKAGYAPPPKGTTWEQKTIEWLTTTPGSHNAAAVCRGLGREPRAVQAVSGCLYNLHLKKLIRRTSKGHYAALPGLPGKAKGVKRPLALPPHKSGK